jgi:hypothetical protein
MKRFRAQVRANVRTVFRARSLALALGCTVAAGGAIAFRLPAQAQTPSTVDIRIVPPETTNGGSLNAGGLLTQVVVFNTGSAPLANVQVVVRVPNAPALVQNVAENGAPLGVIDARTGLWYHTIASLAEGRSFTFVVNWWNPCAGKWPFAVRANDRRVSTSFQFTGASAAGCGADETSSPTPPAFFDMPWPPTPTSTTTTTIVASAAPTTFLAATTTIGSGGPTTSVATSTIPLAGGASTTVIPAPSAPSTVTPVTTVKPVPTSKKPVVSKKPPTTLEIVCKTVGGRRYCGPKSSALKPGQAKPKEVPITTIKKKKK